MRNAILPALALLVALPGTSAAQTLQLPTFNSFSVGTTVLVPDSGSGFAGSVGRGAMGASQFGSPFLGRSGSGLGAQGGIGTTRATVRIHDFAEEDDRLHELAAARHGARPATSAARPAGKFVAGDAAVSSLAEIRAAQRREDAALAKEIADYLVQARAVREEKPGVARVYYQMAARRATGKERAQILAESARYAPKPPAKRTAAR